MCQRYGGYPWLPIETYEGLLEELSEHVLFWGYFNRTGLVAGILGLHDKCNRALYPLQWSELQKFPYIATDVVCYRSIEIGIMLKAEKVDSGVYAPHKRQRGFKSVSSYNAHWYCNNALKDLPQKISNSYCDV